MWINDAHAYNVLNPPAALDVKQSNKSLPFSKNSKAYKNTFTHPSLVGLQGWDSFSISSVLSRSGCCSGTDAQSFKLRGSSGSHLVGIWTSSGSLGNTMSGQSVKGFAAGKVKSGEVGEAALSSSAQTKGLTAGFESGFYRSPPVWCWTSQLPSLRLLVPQMVVTALTQMTAEHIGGGHACNVPKMFLGHRKCSVNGTCYCSLSYFPNGQNISLLLRLLLR